METTILLILTYSVIISGFCYYFYYNGTGNVVGILLIPALSILSAFLCYQFAQTGNVTESKTLTMIAFFGLLFGAFMGTIIYIRFTDSLKTRECDLMDTVYGELNTEILSIKSSDEKFKYNLRDYYIKTAYNCCSGGEYKNDYVTMCTLTDLLKQGVRCLDFEIYSIDDKPVVATSTVDNYHVKETFNSIQFSEILQTIVDNAFSDSGAPNPRDPIILHLRIKSENQKMYNHFADLLEKYNNILLDKSYSYENSKNNLVTNFGATPLTQLMGKISIIVDRSNPAFLECKRFYEYVNMASNSLFARKLSYDDLKNSSDINELIEYNKQCMTIGTPNKGANPANPSSVVMREMGCQMLAMRYQLADDTNLEENDIFFNENNSAFVLKPENLRYKPIVIEAPEPQDPKLSYKSRTVKSDYYNFKI